MIEKIGKAVLDDTCYPGQDLYSDGAIEDEMLEIARTYPKEQWNQVIAERKSWPILYHFSHVRENILSWLPFTGKENVLEIGSGCGAITGALCKKAEKVTCIELSKKRSEINAWRHKDCENLTILMGNFQEIEPALTEKYDYITLIGVFEYGENYIQSDTPYVDFLKTIARHLKPGGQIVLAIENRFGLKYWAGCTEDHFGTLFEGLEGYPTTKGVKTFTKKELTEILEKAGNLKAQWYYPFPDYKLPMTIYSDRRIPLKGELNRMETNFDRLRLQLFQESPVYDSLLDNDMFPEFSNSFLLLIGKEQICPEIVYTKFSNERDARFALRTDLEELFFYYLKKVQNLHSTDTFIKTPEFVQVFGDVELTGEYSCAKMSNIDLVPANILILKDRQVVIDYEWTFDFPVPADFILYRMIHYYLESDGKRRVLKDRDFYGKAGITQEELDVYGEMERNFQKYMQGSHVPLLSMYEDVSPGKVEILPYYEQMRAAGAERRLQVFFDRGKGFSEEDSEVYPMSRTGVSMELEIPDNVKNLRLDPGEVAGGLILRKLVFENDIKADFTTNGFPVGADSYYFGGGDPQFVIGNISEEKRLRIEIEIMKAQDAGEKFWKSFGLVSAEKDEEIRRLKEKISQMENTKVWKLYRSIKKK